MNNLLIVEMEFSIPDAYLIKLCQFAFGGVVNKWLKPEDKKDFVSDDIIRTFSKRFKAKNYGSILIDKRKLLKGLRRYIRETKDLEVLDMENLNAKNVNDVFMFAIYNKVVRH